jgi:hypothetical protein
MRRVAFDERNSSPFRKEYDGVARQNLDDDANLAARLKVV